MEFEADIRAIRRQSQQGALTIFRAVNKTLHQLRPFPERGRVDGDAPDVPSGISARKLSTRGYVIRYLYPVNYPRGRRSVLILSIRDGARLPVSDVEFLRRYAIEQVRLRREVRPGS